MSAYAVAKADGLIKLDVMENPYRLPKDLAKQLGERLSEVAINRYPVPSAERLRGLLREKMAIPQDFDILLGNGSDECIGYITASIGQEKAVVMAPVPSFPLFAMQALFYRLPFVGVPLRGSDFNLDMGAMIEAIKEYRPRLLWLASPNNPTGTAWARNDLESLIVAASPGLVVIDEAYQPFAMASFLPQLSEYPNAVIMRTTSKIGLAGLRLGYVIGHPLWITEFNKVRSPFNVNVLTETAGCFLLEHKAVLDEQAHWICAERVRLLQVLQSWGEVQTWESHTNFILLRTLKGKNASEVFQAMRNLGILIKDISKAHPLLHDCLRITVGTPEENNAMLEALGKVLGRSGK